MKIKVDFVTNSSSTSYVIAIPNNFNPVEYAKDVIDRYMISGYFLDTKGEGTEQDAINYYINCFIESFNVQEVTIFNEIDDPDKYLITREFGRHLGLVISSTETDSDRGTCTMIPEKAFQKILTKVNK